MIRRGSVLITGATGFVGRVLLDHLVKDGWHVRALTRRGQVVADPSASLAWFLITGLDDELPLSGCDAVIHLAARVHVMNEQAVDPLAEFRRVNVQLTERLAREAAAKGVRRFVYLSSIKVNGEETLPGRPFLADDLPNPEDAYGVSKLEAEMALRQVAADTGMEVVVVRPPLVYGPGGKGNFLAMLGWLRRGLPLPLGAVNNQRSFVGVDNLCDLLRVCLDHPEAANEVFLASDGRDLSTTELLRLAGISMGRPALLLSVPVPMLSIFARVIGKASVARRLCCNLQADIGKTEQLLGWKPPVSVETGLRRIFEIGKSR